MIDVAPRSRITATVRPTIPGGHAGASGVGSGDDAGAGVGQQHRGAVGHQDRQGEVDAGRDEGVDRGRRAGARGAVDHVHVGAVALVHEQQSLAGHAHGRGDASPVRRDVGRVVTDVTAEVEAVPRPPADTVARVGEPQSTPLGPLSAPTGPCSRHRHTRTTLTAHGQDVPQGAVSRIG